MTTRSEQLRTAKRRQRLKDREAGQVLYQLKLPVAMRERLKVGMSSAAFVTRFHEFLQHEIVRIDDYPSLALLCWNRNLEYMTRGDAFALYERNWRLIDTGALSAEEASFIDGLKEEFARNLINA